MLIVFILVSIHSNIFLNNKFNLIKIEYCKDNEFILALFEKSNKKEFNFNYEEENHL